jgi:integrase
MPRTIRDSNLDTRAARGRLRARPKPYYRSLEPGLHLGYRKPLSGSGKWLARHYCGDQRYELEVIATADDFSDADGVAVLSYKQAQAKARERMVARAHHAAGKHGPVTVADAMAAYFEFLEAHRKTARDARVRAKALIIPELGNVEVQALTSERIRKWHLGLTKVAARVRTRAGDKQQHGAPDNGDDGVRRRRSTANRMLTTLKAALNLAWREGRTSSDATWRRVKPFEGVDAARVRYLEVAECKRLINGCADDDFRRLVQAALATGCRYGELCRFTVADFSADGGTIAIRQSKSGKARHVVLNDEGAAMFRQWCAGRPGAALLLTHDDGQPWAKSHQDLRMNEACKRAGIEPPISFHGLRHSWASLAVMAGMPLMVVAKNLGHSSTRMVEQHYGHLAPSYVADEIRRSAPKFGFRPSRKIVSL